MSATASARRLEPHIRIAGKFQLRRRLAAGGMGDVWVARNESTGADVALKVLRRGDADHERELQIEERFRHEATLSAMLSHRSIVKVFDLIEEPTGLLVLVMELLRGETLQAYLERRSPLPGREGVAIVCPILSALAHAHDRGIVHRDVTPANIFLAVDPDGHVTPKLVDFGIAKLASGAPLPATRTQAVQTVDGRVLGTPRYMAPERIRAAVEIDGRADLFSIAVVLYEALTGACPFAASSASASLAAVLERPVDPDPRIDPRLWVEIRRAMSKRAYERHGTAQELATALRNALGDEATALEDSLRRSSPPGGWDGEDPGADTARAQNDTANGSPDARTIDGQSLAAGIPRRRVAPAIVWAGGALVIAAIVAAGLGLRARPAETPHTLGPAAAAPAPLAIVPPPPLATSASAPPNALAAGPPPASPRPTPASPAAAAIGTHTPLAATAPARSPAPPRPKPIATTPGF